MIGYGSEDDHFVLELTYNYTVKEYKRGNDFQVCCTTNIQGSSSWASCVIFGLSVYNAWNKACLLVLILI